MCCVVEATPVPHKGSPLPVSHPTGPQNVGWDVLQVSSVSDSSLEGWKAPLDYFDDVFLPDMPAASLHLTPELSQLELQVYIYICVYTYVCMYVCYVCIYIHVHIYVHADPHVSAALCLLGAHSVPSK